MPIRFSSNAQTEAKLQREALYHDGQHTMKDNTLAYKAREKRKHVTTLGNYNAKHVKLVVFHLANSTLGNQCFYETPKRSAKEQKKRTSEETKKNKNILPQNLKNQL